MAAFEGLRSRNRERDSRRDELRRRVADLQPFGDISAFPAKSGTQGIDAQGSETATGGRNGGKTADRAGSGLCQGMVE
jgi:hypothetical protein